MTSPRSLSAMLILAASLCGALLLSACPDRSDPPEFRYYDANPAADFSREFPTGPPPVWTGEVVQIATFNVQRLFDTVCDSGSCDSGDYEALPTRYSFEAQADRLAEAIADLDADVVLLQEIETQAGLDALFIRLRDRFADSEIAETGSPASVDVAVLANGRIVETVGHRDQPLYRPDGSETSFAREFFEVHIALSEDAVADERTELIVFVAHFKSKYYDDPGRRLAEAEAAHDIVTTVAQANPELLVVMGGDLNDVPDSPPIDALEDDGLLLRVASDVPVEDAFTYVYSGRGQSIDHLFLALDSGGGYVPESSIVFWDPSYSGYGGSDHAALRADFRLNSPTEH